MSGWLSNWKWPSSERDPKPSRTLADEAAAALRSNAANRATDCPCFKHTSAGLIRHYSTGEDVNQEQAVSGVVPDQALWMVKLLVHDVR